MEQTIRNCQFSGEEIDEDGIEEAFTFIDEFNETITSGTWINNDCFLFTTTKGSISYLIGNKILKLTNCEKKYFILGYENKQNRVYLTDKSLNMTCYQLLLPLINYQAAILNEDLQGAQAYFSDIPEHMHSKLAKFLEANDQKELAFDITPDQDHKFDLALHLNRIDEAQKIADNQQSAEKWKKVGDIALINGSFLLAERCFKSSKDFNSLLLFYQSYGDAEGIEEVAKTAEEQGKLNIAFQAYYNLADADSCLNILIKSKRYSEAAMFARAYLPSRIGEMTKLWEDSLKEKRIMFLPEKIEESSEFAEVLAKALTLEPTMKE